MGFREKSYFCTDLFKPHHVDASESISRLVCINLALLRKPCYTVGNGFNFGECMLPSTASVWNWQRVGHSIVVTRKKCCYV